MPLPDALAEGARQMAICNACRYCEGYCAVFPAMERRLTFAAADMRYLANLCHNCGECLHACQYAPPHEFAVDVPRAMARIRLESYRRYAWPAVLAGAYRANGVKAAVVLILALVSALLAAATFLDPEALLTKGDFYAVVPHAVMAWGFGAVGLLVLLALAIGVVRFWGEAGNERIDARALRGLRDALTLRNLHASGADCAQQEEARRPLRRWFHHFTFYGFMLCFAATVAGTVYHYGFGWPAPYPYASLPVALGTLGGIGLLIGPAGLYFTRTLSHEDEGMDTAFILLLGLTSLTGLLLLAFRQTSAMGLLLIIHLAVVLALFLTLPYGKFVHGLYRAAALAKSALEREKKDLIL